MFCIGANRWRILRLIHLSGGTARWDDVRTRTRKDPETAAVLARAGLVTFDGPAVRLTARGREVQDLGQVTLAEWKLMSRSETAAEGSHVE